MNEKLEKLLDLLIMGIEKGESLASSEISLIMEEIVNYGFWSNILALIIPLILFILCLIPLVYHIVKMLEKQKNEEFDHSIATGMFGIGLCMISIFLFCSANNLLKVVTSPKMYTIEYINNSLKK